MQDSDEEPPCSKEVEEFLKGRGYVIGEKISYGSYGKVYKAVRFDEEIAVKVINLKNTSRETRNKFLPRETFALKTLRHKNVIVVHDIFTLTNKIYIFMSLGRGDLIDVLEKNGAFQEEQCKILFKEIVDGLEFVHNHGLTHRDLKVDNILLDKNGHAIITDFGFARRVYDKVDGRRVLAETYCGTTAYIAPEVLEQKPYNPQMADVWSLGVVLYLMMNDTFPFDDNDDKKMLIAQQNRDYVIEQNWSSELKDLIAKMLEPNLQERITVPQILAHPWLAGVENKTPQLITDT
ncbi:testis-specific serine/threonine-protein kinase 1-like protein 1 [Leptotrombidium deliense]|uniref:non-specific serine/threonine protein kinase n=1 Tax=Leptotrombidium deliense TaxID=299467 RepID=A0A443SS56_9ACAR|nr:testis-specific serine/threonine-protein kinase 1-like protein 1 [Leptotrombidium deliense]